MPTLNDSFKFLEEIAPQAFGVCRTMLYVGHRHDTHPWWCTRFRTALGNPALDVLDIQQANLDTAKNIEGVRQLILGDVRHTAHSTPPYDLVFWDGGPEHLPRVEVLDLLQEIAATQRHVLISCPWGYQPQGSGPTDYEFHHWGPMPEDFTAIGWNVHTNGLMFDGLGHGHGDLHAWV